MQAVDAAFRAAGGDMTGAVVVHAIGRIADRKGIGAARLKAICRSGTHLGVGRLPPFGEAGQAPALVRAEILRLLPGDMGGRLAIRCRRALRRGIAPARPAHPAAGIFKAAAGTLCLGNPAVSARKARNAPTVTSVRSIAKLPSGTRSEACTPPRPNVDINAAIATGIPALHGSARITGLRFLRAAGLSGARPCCQRQMASAKGRTIGMRPRVTPLPACPAMPRLQHFEPDCQPGAASLAVADQEAGTMGLRNSLHDRETKAGAAEI